MALICQVVVFKREKGRRQLTYQRKPCVCQSSAVHTILNSRAKVMKPAQYLYLHGNSIPALSLWHSRRDQNTLLVHDCTASWEFFLFLVNAQFKNMIKDRERVNHEPLEEGL